MTGCVAFRPLLSAYLDGELVGAEKTALETHAGRCGECRRALDDETAMALAVARSVERPEAPAHLRERVHGLFEARRPSPRAWIALAAAMAAALAAVATWMPSRRPEPAPPSAASELAAFVADSHLRVARGQVPFEVRSDRPEEVAAWFQGRVPFHFTLPEYPAGPGAKPYQLHGGRLVTFGGEYAALLAYRMDERPITLLITSSDRVRPGGGDLVPFGPLTFHLEGVSGLKVISWSDKGLTYAIASELPVSGAQSCLVCHGSPDERRRLERFPSPADPGPPRP
jgi:anti-sigma factor RsiW